LAVALAVVFGLAAPLRAAELYREPFRPQFHFTPERNWMNDPNGMVYYDGEYHLFYQHNPKGDKWGHMSWGHAVSHDLIHWEHLPLALPEENGVMIFSGSAVVDWKNTTGFGKEGKPPLVAIYTGHHTAKPLQNQHIAYSNDRGRTWTKFAGNPCSTSVPRISDPQILWHESTSQWVTTIAMPTDANQILRFAESERLDTARLVPDRQAPSKASGSAGFIRSQGRGRTSIQVGIDRETSAARGVAEVPAANTLSASSTGAPSCRIPLQPSPDTGRVNGLDRRICKLGGLRETLRRRLLERRAEARRSLAAARLDEQLGIRAGCPTRRGSADVDPRSLTLSRVNDQWRLVQSPVRRSKAAGANAGDCASVS
jgi:hypothetical protein